MWNKSLGLLISLLIYTDFPDMSTNRKRLNLEEKIELVNAAEKRNLLWETEDKSLELVKNKQFMCYGKKKKENYGLWIQRLWNSEEPKQMKLIQLLCLIGFLL